MTLVLAAVGSNHFPTLANPATPENDAVYGSPPSLATGTPTPTAAAACLGKFIVNGVNISGAGGSAGAGLLDLTTWGNKDIIAAINGSNTGVAASINRDGKIVLQTATGVAINIAGDATILAALGFTAGAYQS